MATTSMRDFIISIDTSKNKISRLRYEKENGILKIFLATDQKVEQRDVALEPGAFYYDLIITLDAPDMESLGSIFKDNTELFFGKPTLNIDHKSANEYFGEINLVEPTAAACAEIVTRLIEGLGPNLFSRESATALLTGLIEKTHSFQNAKTTPQALNLASLLITKGGQQEKIIQHLYKTVPLNRLKLWGRLLSQLDFDTEKNAVWLLAANEDFSATQTSPRDLPYILEEIDDLFPQVSFSFVIWTDETGLFWALIKAKKAEVLQKMNLEFGGTLKNEKLLLKLAVSDAVAAKDQLSSSINLFA